MDKEYFLELEEGAIAYVYFKTTKGDVSEFVVKLLTLFEGEWHEVIRYDSGHGCPHKDILNINGEVIRKVWYDFLDKAAIQTLKLSQ
jgi:hypothetical protein